MLKRFVVFASFIVVILANKKIGSMIGPFVSDITWVPKFHYFMATLPAILAIWVLISLFTLVELMDHRDWKRVRRTFFKGLIIWAAYYAISYPVWQSTNLLTHKFGIGPILDLSGKNWFGLEFLIAFLIIDFFYYWFHRSQHVFTFLWRFHAFHHSLEDLSASNSYHHWTEEFFRILIFSLPIAILLRPSAESFFLISAFAGAWGIYIHSDSRHAGLPWPIREVIVDNIYHHCHHGIEERYHNKNFGAYISLWDKLFGTQIMPRNIELPETGIDGLREPRLIEYFGLGVPKSKEHAAIGPVEID